MLCIHGTARLHKDRTIGCRSTRHITNLSRDDLTVTSWLWRVDLTSLTRQLTYCISCTKLCNVWLVIIV